MPLTDKEDYEFQFKAHLNEEPKMPMLLHLVTPFNHALLTYSRLLVDVAGRQLIRIDDLSTISYLVDAFHADAPHLYLPILRRYPQLTQPDFSIENLRHVYGQQAMICTLSRSFGYMESANLRSTESQKVLQRKSRYFYELYWTLCCAIN
ncbi:hypothetical protein CAPTEDRAFT_201221 [Capitella teleta]|uniref:Uncharacterized protein n=1 Tax=Capitella teleta TaxID=283909 RepID=R7VDC7_CAPTE|nr:hypothetical protein CAPTEDRAFT_201221 [Capitella teleta]|eukprot:ELU16843.1 hypothetical protein CAPTEDRAFT_201221 [Capitella teleta]